MEQITVQQAAELAGVHVQSVRRWIAEGKLKAFKRAGRNALWLDRGQVEQFIAPVEVKPGPVEKQLDLPMPVEKPKARARRKAK